MNEPLGYNAYNSDTGRWLSESGHWKDAYWEAGNFKTLEFANDAMLRVQGNEHTLYVFACMPSP